MGNWLNCCASKKKQADDELDEDLNTLKPGDARWNAYAGKGADLNMNDILEGKDGHKHGDGCGCGTDHQREE